MPPARRHRSAQRHSGDQRSPHIARHSGGCEPTKARASGRSGRADGIVRFDRHGPPPPTCSGHHGAKALREAISDWRPRRTRSELEDRFQALLDASALRSAFFNVLLEGENDVHEVDAVWPACRLVIQLDGFAYHRTRRDRERDAATDADLELVGYRVVRLTWSEVTTHRVRTTRRLRLLISDT
jgi:very-short-patch-repair endonuclease